MKPWYLLYGRAEGKANQPVFVCTQLPVTWKDLLLVLGTLAAFWISLAGFIRQFTARRP